MTNQEYIYIFNENIKSNTITNNIHHSSCSFLRRSLKSNKRYQKIYSDSISSLEKKLEEEKLNYGYCCYCPSKVLDNVKEVLKEVEEISGKYVPREELPKEYNGKGELKAFLLGCDPGNRSSNGEPIFFKKVFGLENENSMYFKPNFDKNLKQVNLLLDNLYVQNLCRNYFKIETYKQRRGEWKKCARLWIPLLKKELDLIDRSGEIPVLISSEIILEVLLFDKKPDCETIYKTGIIFNEDTNFLSRNLIAFFRSPKYRLNKNEWRTYKEIIMNSIHGC